MGGGERHGRRHRFRGPPGRFGGGRKNGRRARHGGGCGLSQASSPPLRGIGRKGSGLLGDAAGDRASSRSLSTEKPGHRRPFCGHVRGGGGGAPSSPPTAAWSRGGRCLPSPAPSRRRKARAPTG